MARVQKTRTQTLELQNRGFEIFGPLRSQDKPVGLGILEGLDKIRTAANIVYSTTAAVLRFGIANMVLRLLENPANSWFLGYPDIDGILREHVGFSVYFHQYPLVGKRNKKTLWWSSQGVFSTQSTTCGRSHKQATRNPKNSKFSAYVSDSRRSCTPDVALQACRGLACPVCTDVWSTTTKNT